MTFCFALFPGNNIVSGDGRDRNYNDIDGDGSDGGSDVDRT